ncbi:hypothetical protein AVO42_10490 [Thiomicrospira sp. XS5]|nr:hypothetical protein AVO42_10490 [Thiomicrospira sp. XS5]
MVWGLVTLLMLVSLPASAQNTGTSQEANLENVIVKLKWHHQFQFAGYYAAQKQGYYRDEGLSVELQPRDLLENNIEQVLNGEGQYGVSDSILLLYQARQKPIVIVAPIFQHSPQVLFTLKSSGLDSPYKLEDKMLAFYKKDTDGLSVLAMLEELAVKPVMDRVIIDKSPVMLVRKEVDAYAGYLANEAYFFKKNNVPYNVINPMNFGIDLYGDMLFTTQDEAQNHPDRVAKMRRATIKGWRYAMAHKAEMARYIQQQYGVDKSFQHLMFEANVIQGMMDLNNVPIGTLNEGRLRFIANLFRKQGLLKGEVDLQNGIYRSENQAIQLTQREKDWIKEHPVIRLGIDRAYAPIEFVNEQGEYDGITPSFLEFVSQRTGLEFKPSLHLSWPDVLTEFKAHELDVLPAVIETEERKTYMNFTQAYLKFPMVVATRDGVPYVANFKQLQGKRIAVVKNYAAHEALHNVFPEMKLTLVNSAKQGLEAVSNGEAFGYVDNVAVIGYHIKKYGLTSLQISGEMPFHANIAMGVRQDWPELLSIFQKVLQQIPKQRYVEMTNSWLQINYKTEYSWTQLLLILAPVLLLLAVFIFFNRKLRHTQDELRASNDKLSVLSVTDHLTGIYNRQYLDQVLDAEVERVDRYHSKLSLVMMDLDNFKQVNDTFGHLVGDEVLVKSVETIHHLVRKTDTFGRWGGEEFILICPETDLHQASQLAEKVRAAIESTEFSHGIRLTFSLGVAQYQAGELVNECIDRADRNLYRAKHNGKNQVSVSEA